ncbi:MAG: hypothetical protein KatS3mg043_0590 [Rhodothermaceae bacterium]|nr:MAG: hypothetical protein KatS3mg043_0590 [Rhodothermaceae bacterium]
MIEVDHIYKSFNGKSVLEDVSLTIHDGETLAIIGRSGSGKSVLMKHLIGLLKPDRGRVLVDGVDIDAISYDELRQIRRQFGVLFQGGALFDSMNAFENVAFPLRTFTNMSESEIRREVQQCLEMVQLPDVGSKMPAELSGGMRKRVALARAVALRPRYVIYDEPTSGLDPETSNTIDELIKSLTDQLHMTNIVVTHDMHFGALDWPTGPLSSTRAGCTGSARSRSCTRVTTTCCCVSYGPTSTRSAVPRPCVPVEPPSGGYVPLPRSPLRGHQCDTPKELKVGLSILIAAVIFILGVRFFEDLPLFRGTMSLETAFENAGGLIAGNTVRINGVVVGSVDEVRLDPASNRVRVRFHVDSGIKVPEGSRTRISGFDALNVVRLDLLLGPPGNPPIPEGGFVPSETGTDLLGTLTDRAPALVDRVDSVLVGLDATLTGTRALLNDPGSDLRQTLAALRTSLGTLNAFLRSEQGRMRRVLQNTEALTAASTTSSPNRATPSASSCTTSTACSPGSTATWPPSSPPRPPSTRSSPASTGGEGTLGRLLADDTLYFKLDATLTNLNNLVTEFQAHPRKYLRELKLIDIF